VETLRGRKGAQMSEDREAGADKVDTRTKDEEEREARATHTADRPPTAEEESAAEQTKLDPDVAAHEREMDRLGAEVKGEGEIA
jgi:hypothetical protein